MIKDRLFDILMPIVPKNDMSHLVGRLVHKRLPTTLARKSVEWFQKYYAINMDEAELPLAAYRSIGELFTRRLKAGARPIGDGPVLHPADAKISEAGEIHELTMIQAKGKTYTVPELIRSAHFSPSFDGGSYLTYYLCPTDYHRVHSPVSGEIVWSCHVPGLLWPVNAWSVESIEHLFTVNERVVTVIQTPRGLAAVVMVAATNVGNMTVSYDSKISTRVRESERHARTHTYKPAVKIEKGDELGIFHMGSTVIVLYQKGVLEGGAELFKGRHVKVNRSLN